MKMQEGYLDENEKQEEEGEFGELLRYTLTGYLGGLLLGGTLDFLGFQRSAIGQWLVRTISGEGESLLEGLFAFRRRIGGGKYGMAEAYGWGELIGMTIPWWIDWGSRAIGVDVYGVQGFYIPFFYAMSDQVGANLSGLLYLRRNADSWGGNTQELSSSSCHDQRDNSDFFGPTGFVHSTIARKRMELN